MIDNEILEAMRDLLTPISIRLENMEPKMNNIRLEMNRGFRKNKDEIQTIVAVLEAKDILPVAK